MNYLKDEIKDLEQTIQRLGKQMDEKQVTWETLVAHRGQARHETLDGILSAIDKNDSEMKALFQKHKQTEAQLKQRKETLMASYPIVYIIADTDSAIRNNLGKKYRELKKNNYIPAAGKDYTPFVNDEPKSIGAILENIKASKGREFLIKYLNNDLADNELYNMINNKSKVILIFDAFSLYGKNRDLALRFDHKKMGGVFILMPPFMSPKSQLSKDISSNIDQIFRCLNYATDKGETSNYFSYLNHYKSFRTTFVNRYNQMCPTNPNDDVM